MSGWPVAALVVMLAAGGCSDDDDGGDVVQWGRGDTFDVGAGSSDLHTVIAEDPIIDEYFDGVPDIGTRVVPDDYVILENFHEDSMRHNWYWGTARWVKCFTSEVAEGVIALRLTSTDGLIETIERIEPPDWATRGAPPPEDFEGPTDSFEC